MKMKTGLIFSAAAAVAAMLGNSAQANTVELFNAGGTPNFVGTTLVSVTYDYLAVLTPGNTVSNPAPGFDVAAFYDFQGFLGGTANAYFTASPTSPTAAYTFVSSADGDTTELPEPSFLIGRNDLSFDDIRFVYTGSGPITNTGTTDLILGTFHITSSLASAAVDTWYTTDSTGGHFGNVIVPRAGGDTSVLPLPATACGGMALFGLLGVKRKKRASV